MTLLGGGYVCLYWQAGQQVLYYGLREPVHYWLVFPYGGTLWLAVLMTLVFGLGFFDLMSVFISGSKGSRWGWLLRGLRVGIPLLALVVMSLTLLNVSLNRVGHLDSLPVGDYRYHLIYKNNHEYPAMYYLVACRRFTFFCQEVARFPTGDHIVVVDVALKSRLERASMESLQVVNGSWVIFTYPLPKQ